MKRKILNIVLLIVMSLLFACNSSKQASQATVESTTEAPKQNNEVENKKIKIVTTIYPMYDWVNNIIKGKEDKFDVQILMTSGVDLHNFQPSAKDILDVGNSDLFIYVGGESDAWVDGVVAQKINQNLKTISLMEVLKDQIKVEEAIEGMEEEEEHHHEEGEEHKEGEEHEEEIEYDEHVWLSLKNADIATSKITQVIAELDRANEETYFLNGDKYVAELQQLHGEYLETVNNAKRKLLLFGDRFPFRYMVDDYDLKYYAAFKGCAAETEASFKTIKFLADKLSEENWPYVMKIERSDEKIARAVIENSTNKDAKIETMYSIQAVSADDIKNGETYLSYMRKNLEVLKKVLN